MRWFALLLVGCYQPADVDACLVSCVNDVDCPGSLTCIAGVCGTGCADADLRACAGQPGGLLGRVCFDPAMLAPVTLTGMIDTADTTMCTPYPDHPELCVIAGSPVVTVGSVKVKGARPLVVWSADTIVIATGTVLDASSVFNSRLGPGANDNKCPNLDAAIENGTTPIIGAGGCGGGFGGVGGAGGSAGRIGGQALGAGCTSTTQVVDHVRGGCRGGHGGASGTATSPNGGNSGGAVYLIAGAQISVNGLLVANGSGATAALGNSGTTSGGGGGGSGGLIAFDAPAVLLEGATVLALGGGGSSGSGFDTSNNIIQGHLGISPSTSPPMFAGSSMQTVGTNDGGGTQLDGHAGGSVNVSTSTGGGGGGGGGVGRIVVFSPIAPDPGSSSVIPDLEHRP